MDLSFDTAFDGGAVGSRVCIGEGGGLRFTCDFCRASGLTARYAGEVDARVAASSREDWNT
jgi:hypothetical protein